MTDLNHGAVLEDPAYCPCGVKRQSRKGVYFCTNCDSVQPQQMVGEDRSPTLQDAKFNLEFASRVESWFDPIDLLKMNGEPERFEDLGGI